MHFDVLLVKILAGNINSVRTKQVRTSLCSDDSPMQGVPSIQTVRLKYRPAFIKFVVLRGKNARKEKRQRVKRHCKQIAKGRL